MHSDAAEILETTAEALGHKLVTHHLIRESVSGDGLIRSYEVQLSDAQGATTSEVLYLETAQHSSAREGVLVFRNEETLDEVSVWLYPKDPQLPALPSAVYPNATAVILQKMGFDPSGISLSLVAYRPGKRAVVRIVTDATVVYMKVIRPHLSQELHDLYQLWRDAGLPVPATLGWTAEGLVGFAALTGAPAIDVVHDLGENFLDSVEQLINQYSSIASTTEARASLATRVDWYERRVSVQHPELTTRAHDLSEKITTILQTTGRPAPVTIHGDLHLGQIFVDPHAPDSVTGVLDIDTAGLGDPADDAGALYAHLIVSSLFERSRVNDATAADAASRADHFARLASMWRRRWNTLESDLDPDFTNRANAVAATHLLAHTLGGLVPAHLLIEHAEAVLTEGENPLV